MRKERRQRRCRVFWDTTKNKEWGLVLEGAVKDNFCPRRNWSLLVCFSVLGGFSSHSCAV